MTQLKYKDCYYCTQGYHALPYQPPLGQHCAQVVLSHLPLGYVLLPYEGVSVLSIMLTSKTYVSSLITPDVYLYNALT